MGGTQAARVEVCLVCVYLMNSGPSALVLFILIHMITHNICVIAMNLEHNNVSKSREIEWWSYYIHTWLYNVIIEIAN